MKVQKQDLEQIEKSLRAKGYTRYKGHFKEEDFGYWKSFKTVNLSNGGTVTGYQIAFLFFDFGKYNVPGHDHYNVQYEYLSGDPIDLDRADFTVCDNYVTIEEFEDICEKMYSFLYNLKPRQINELRYPQGRG
jgi:hypothetical protein